MVEKGFRWAGSIRTILVLSSVLAAVTGLVAAGSGLAAGPPWGDASAPSEPGTGEAPVSLAAVDAAMQAGAFHSAWRLLAPLLEAAGSNPRADLVLRAGRIQQRLDHPFRALELLQEAERLMAEEGDTRGQALARGYMGSVHVDLVHPVTAISMLEEAARALRDDPAIRSCFIIEIGTVYLRTREAELAIDQFQEALEIARDAALPAMEARALLHLGFAAVDTRKPHEALDYMDQAAKIYASESLPRLEAAVHQARVYPLLVLGKYDEAVKAAEEAVSLLPEPWKQPDDAVVSPDLGAHETLWKVYEWKGDYTKVFADQDRLLADVAEYMASIAPPPPAGEPAEAEDGGDMAGEDGEAPGGATVEATVEVEVGGGMEVSSDSDVSVVVTGEGEGDVSMDAVVAVEAPTPTPVPPPRHAVEGAVYEYRGALLDRLGQVSRAVDAYREACAIYRDKGLIEDEVRVHARLSRLARRARNMARLDNLTVSADVLADGIEDLQLKAALDRTAGLNLATAGRLEEGVSRLEKAASLYQEAGNPTRQGVTLLDIARVLDRAGDVEGAVDRMKEAVTVFHGAGDLDWLKKTVVMLERRYAKEGDPLRGFVRRFQSLTLPNAQVWAPPMHAPLGEYANTTWLFRYLGTQDLFGDNGSFVRPAAYPFDMRSLPFDSLEAFAGEVLEYDRQRLATASAASLGDSMAMAEALAAKCYYYDEFLLVGFRDEALNSAATTLDAFAKAGIERLHSVMLTMMSEIYLESGATDVGLRFLRKRQALDEQMGDVAGAESAMMALIHHYLNHDQARRAFKTAEEGIALADAQGDARMEALFLARKAEAQWTLEATEKALQTSQEAYELASEIHCPVASIAALSVMGAAQKKLGQAEEATATVAKAGNIPLVPVVLEDRQKLFWMGDAYHRLGLDDRARDFYRMALKACDKKQDVQDFALAREKLEELP